MTSYLNGKVAEASGNDELAAEWNSIEELYTRKLWHQLTLKLLEFVRHESLSEGTALVELYENLIKDLEDRINPFSLVRLIYAVIAQIPDPEAAIALLGPIKEKVSI